MQQEQSIVRQRIAVPEKLKAKVEVAFTELQKLENQKTAITNQLNSLVEGFLAGYEVEEEDVVRFSEDRSELLVLGKQELKTGAVTPIREIGPSQDKKVTRRAGRKVTKK